MLIKCNTDDIFFKYFSILFAGSKHGSNVRKWDGSLKAIVVIKEMLTSIWKESGEGKVNSQKNFY